MLLHHLPKGIACRLLLLETGIKGVRKEAGPGAKQLLVDLEGFLVGSNVNGDSFFAERLKSLSIFMLDIVDQELDLALRAGLLGEAMWPMSQRRNQCR